MNKYENPPSNSSLATSCAESVMACSEAKVAALFSEGVPSSAEWELSIDETASTVSLAANVCVAPGVSAAVQTCDECVEEFVDHLGGSESAAHPFVLEGGADENDSFVDIMSGITAVGNAESEGLILLIRWHVRTCRWRPWQRLLSTHLVCLHLSLLSSFLLSF